MFAAFASLTLLAQSAAPAVSPPPNRKVEATDAAAVAAADRLLTAMDYDQLMRRTTDAIVAQSGPALKRSLEREIGEEVDDELINRLQKLQRSHMETLLLQDKNLRRATALLYARHFTAAELDRLTALYADPVMKKWTEVAPALMGDMMPLMVDLMSAHRPEMKKQIEKLVLDYYSQKEVN